MRAHQRSIVVSIVAMSIGLMISVRALSPTPNSRPLDTPTNTPTPCPKATAEPMAVEPVITLTQEFSQTIIIRLGNGEVVTVTSESGVYSKADSFGFVSNPALVDIWLLPNTTHHLAVYGKVRQVNVDGCLYGGYTLFRDVDRNYNPLVITQVSSIEFNYQAFLPVISK